MPRVSVIMPVLNSADTLPRAIDSILAQTMTDFEFIIVNEYGSNDGSKEIVEEYAAKDARVKLLQLYERAGIAKSLNIGIRASSGEYIARMDADDYSYLERFAKQIDFLDNNSEYILCGTAYRVVSSDGSNIPPTFEDDARIKANLIWGPTLCHPTVMFRRDLFFKKNIWYNEEILAEDFDLWTRINDKLANLPEILLDYYWGDNNSTAKFFDQAVSYGCNITKQQLGYRLGISSDEYHDYIFHMDKYRGCNDMVETMTQCVRLLLSIERSNNKNHIYDSEALSESLCARYNRYVTGFFASQTEYTLGLPLCEKIAGISFTDVLSQTLGCNSKSLVNCVSNIVNNTWGWVCPSNKIIIYGRGQRAKWFFSRFPNHLKYIICFCDSNPSFTGDTFFGKPVIGLNDLNKYKYDYILISSRLFFEEIARMLSETKTIDMTKVSSLNLLYLLDFKASNRRYGK